MKGLLPLLALFSTSSVVAAPAVRLALSNDRCLIEACPPASPVPPTVTAAGILFNLYVAAKDNANAQDIDYLGIVFFSSTDPFATLPASYTFVPADRGSKSFTAILRTPGMQTITVRDATGNLLPGTLVMTVTGPGVGAPIPTFSMFGRIGLVLGLAIAALLILRLRL